MGCEMGVEEIELVAVLFPLEFNPGAVVSVVGAYAGRVGREPESALVKDLELVGLIENSVGGVGIVVFVVAGNLIPGAAAASAGFLPVLGAEPVCSVAGSIVKDILPLAVFTFLRAYDVRALGVEERIDPGLSLAPVVVAAPGGVVVVGLAGDVEGPNRQLRTVCKSRCRHSGLHRGLCGTGDGKDLGEALGAVISVCGVCFDIQGGILGGRNDNEEFYGLGGTELDAGAAGDRYSLVAVGFPAHSEGIAAPGHGAGTAHRPVESEFKPCDLDSAFEPEFQHTAKVLHRERAELALGAGEHRVSPRGEGAAGILHFGREIERECAGAVVGRRVGVCGKKISVPGRLDAIEDRILGPGAIADNEIVSGGIAACKHHEPVSF